jgi:RNA polymerase sigma-70 factor, ECF subfamily
MAMTSGSQIVCTESDTDTSGLEPPFAAARDRFRVLVNEQGDFVWRALRRLGVWEADLPDTAQQVFLIANRKLGAIRPGSERAFLFQTALRVAANARRMRLRRREVLAEAEFDHVDSGPGPEDYADQRRRRALLDEVLDALPIDARAVFVLSELEGVPMSQIAVLIGIPTGTVASRLRRAREQFDKQVRFLQQRLKARSP